MGEETLMDGYLFKQHKSLMRSWQKKWCILSLTEDDGKAALSMYDSRENAEKEGSTNKKTVYFDLSTNTSVVKNKNKEFYFEITTDAKTYGFAAENKEEMDKWVKILRDVASGSTKPSKKDVSVIEYANNSELLVQEPVKSIPTPMEKYSSQENTAYSSIQKTVFHTVIKPVEKAVELNLCGEYDLILDSVNIALVDPTTLTTLYVWPYKYLRRYGRDRSMFSFEAGRRCDSGPGVFEFSTLEGNDIFYTVDNYVRELKGLPPNPREVLDAPFGTTPPKESTPPPPQRPTGAQSSPVLVQRQPPQRSLPPIPPPGTAPAPDQPPGASRPLSVAEQVRDKLVVTRTRSDTSGVKVKPAVPAKPRLNSISKGSVDKKVKNTDQDKKDITYAETKDRQEAWKQQGRNVNIHVESTFNPEQEDYDVPKRAGPEDSYEEAMFQPKTPALVAAPVGEAYDHLQLKPMKRKPMAATQPNQTTGGGASTYDSLAVSNNLSKYQLDEEDQYETVRQDAMGTLEPVDLKQDEDGYFTHSKVMQTPPVTVPTDGNPYAYASVKANKPHNSEFKTYDEVNN
ncbi:uncharacterized protein LOC144446292 [Glandiceps talaboti]